MWSKLIGFQDSSFSVINFLSSTEKQLKWDADGLPSDQSAVKNAVLINQVRKNKIYTNIINRKDLYVCVVRKVVFKVIP